MIEIIGLFLLFFSLLVALLYKKYKKLYITETYEMYKINTLPYLQKVFIQNTKWIDDMINHKSRQIVYYRNSNFIICKDNKWKTDNINDFYLLAIPTEKIMTIRDLRQIHITLLDSMKYELKRVARAFHIDTNDLVFFFHYMPSIFHLHLHCCIKTSYHATNLSRGMYFYDTILDGLYLDNEYWDNATLSYSLSSDNHIAKQLYLK